MIEFLPDIDKQYILKHVSEEEIYKRYFNLDVSFEGGAKFCSPLRGDRNPTCNFFRHRKSGEIYLKDHAGHFVGNCFDALMVYYGCTFMKSLLIIADDFELIKTNVKRQPIKNELIEREKSDIKFRKRNWNQEDNDYWKSYGISEELLNYFNVCAVQNVFLNGNLMYTYHKTNPAYAYVFGDDDIKIYFPKKKEYRFICNTSATQGYKQLPEKGKTLIITKSMKDILVLYNLGYSAISLQSETQCISEAQYEEFKDRFDNIYSFYDFDLTGIRSANKMRKLYGIPALFLTNGRFGKENFCAKDVSDLLEEILRSNGNLSTLGEQIQLSERLFISNSNTEFKTFRTERTRSKIKNSFGSRRDNENEGYSQEMDDSCPF
tara:strand:+ start:1226 stop:2356 length:1131 start_codon:yes stop_codon:yes gene_type:complete